MKIMFNFGMITHLSSAVLVWIITCLTKQISMGQVLNSGFAQIPCHSIVEQGDGLRTMTALAKRVIMVLKIFKKLCSLALRSMI